MKRSSRRTIALIAALTMAGLTARAANTPAGIVDFGKLTPPANGEFVEVHIRSNLISMVAKLVEKEEPKVAELIRGLKLIRVNVIGTDDKNRSDIEDRVKKIRNELDSKGWERIVTAQSKGEDVGVYIKTRGEEAVEGLVVTVIQPKGEAVLVNIVGDIRPEQITMLGEKFNVEPLKKAGEALKAVKE